ncbi:MAG: M15 family metallopeptidase [Candidatus Woesebacteria bacterium]
MFNKARSSLGGIGYDLRVYDAWRPVDLQEELFWYYLKLFTIKPFGLEEFFSSCQNGEQIVNKLSELPQGLQDKLKEVNRQYVSWPSTDVKCPSPHATGGAVDVWLFEDDKPADLGVPFDWMEASAGAFYHLGSSVQPWPSGDDLAVNFRREILIRAMVSAGFTCYPHEVWHFNFGNQMDAVVRGGGARYGYVEP